MTGVALASAATVVAAVPVIVPTDDIAVASSLPAPLALSAASYELTALYEITPQGIIDAYWQGWGGGLNPEDLYYPTKESAYASGAAGVLYYLIDCARADSCTGQVVDNDLRLYNYFFEVPNIPNTNYGGLSAVINVAVNQAFGQKSIPGQLANAIFKTGVTPTINGLLLAAAEAVVPPGNLGPVKVGGGILASLYFTGATPGEKPSFSYGSIGLSAVLGYIANSISDALTPAAATSVDGKTIKAAAVSATASEAPASGAITSEETTTPAQTATEAAPKADAIQKHTDVTSTESSTAATTPAKTTKTETTKTETSPADHPEVIKTELDETELDKTGIETSLADATTGTKTDSAPKSAAATKAVKPAKPESPLSKLAKSISDALTGKKADRPESGSSNDSAGSGGTGSAGGSATS